MAQVPPPYVTSGSSAQALPQVYTGWNGVPIDRYIELRGSRLDPRFHFEQPLDQTWLARHGSLGMPFIWRSGDGTRAWIGVRQGQDVVVTGTSPIFIDWTSNGNGFWNKGTTVVGPYDLCRQKVCRLTSPPEPQIPTFRPRRPGAQLDSRRVRRSFRAR